MIDYNNVKQTIATNLPDNNKQEITAEKLRSTLNEFVDKVAETETGIENNTSASISKLESEINTKIARLENAGYQFAGVATKDTNPNTPKAKIFYIAYGKGIYTNFDGISVTEDDVVILYYDTTWHKVETGIASNDKLTELQSGLAEKQNIITDLESIRDGANKGSTALQEHQDISYLATKSELSSGLAEKQNIIADLESIRDGANKGNTALQEHQDISHLLPKSEFQAYETKNDGDIQSLKSIDDRFKLLLGYNATRSVVNLELGIPEKYIKCESRSAVSNSSFAISKPFEVDACSELLIKTGFNPSDDTHAALDLTVIAIYEEIERQRKVQKKDGSGNPLYYVVTTDPETGSTTVTTNETTEDTGYPVYVMETYTEVRYLPNNEDRFVAIPDSGYYVANIPQSCKVVISYKPGISDTAVIVEKHGALANLISQVFGIYEHRTMVEAMVSLATRIDALEGRQGLLGNATAGTLDVSEITKCLYPTILKGHGVPSADIIPENIPDGLPWDGVPGFIGQFYINLDAASGGLYYAKGHDSVSDWKQA